MAENNKFKPHDIARLFADDLARYFDISKSYDNLSSTNVYDALNGLKESDSFAESMKVIEKANTFRTEFARDQYLLSTIDIHEGLLQLSDESLKHLREAVCDRENLEDWDFKPLCRYAVLVINLSMMKYRDYLGSLEDETEREKYIHLIFDKYLEVKANEEK